MTQRILIIYGTRPEAIKIAPVVLAMREHPDLTPIVAVTGQHREMLDQVNTAFGITPDHDLDIITPGQTLSGITVKSLLGLEPIIAAEKPAAVLVQGDTTTCFAAALAAFYQQVPVVHLEAGLRTDGRYNPFPEEMNRRLTTQLADVHLAPTARAREALLRDGVHPAAITVTGNTVIDALLRIVETDAPITDPALARLLRDPERPMMLVTSHRRESWGEPLRHTAQAVARIARRFPDLDILLPAHRNPLVRAALLPPLAGLPNVVVTEPLDYSDFSRAMRRSTLVLTDSGGVQEEAPSLGRPVLVLRETTERPEGVEAGSARLVGTDEETIVTEVTRLLTDQEAYQQMAQVASPYGDGRAAERSIAAIAHFFGLGEPPDQFRPDRSHPGA